MRTERNQKELHPERSWQVRRKPQGPSEEIWDDEFEDTPFDDQFRTGF